MRNIAGHRVNLHGVFTTGGDIGFLAALVASVIPVLVAPLLVDGIDAWTFWKGLGSAVFGPDAVDPVLGFAAPAVLAGISIHLFTGMLVGAIFAVVIALLDVDAPAPTILLSGFILAVLAVGLSWVPLAHTLFPALDVIPIVFAGHMVVAFGILLGVGVQDWRLHWDRSEQPGMAAPRRRWMLVAHQRAILATASSLLLLVAAIILDSPGVRLGFVVPLLVMQVAAAALVMRHAITDRRALSHGEAVEGQGGQVGATEDDTRP